MHKYSRPASPNSQSTLQPLDVLAISFSGLNQAQHCLGNNQDQVDAAIYCTQMFRFNLA